MTRAHQTHMQSALYAFLKRLLITLHKTKSFYFKFHFVNWNRDKFLNADQAGTSNNHDGLLVFAILIEVII